MIDKGGDDDVHIMLHYICQAHGRTQKLKHELRRMRQSILARAKDSASSDCFSSQYVGDVACHMDRGRDGGMKTKQGREHQISGC